MRFNLLHRLLVFTCEATPINQFVRPSIKTSPSGKTVTISKLFYPSYHHLEDQDIFKAVVFWAPPSPVDVDQGMRKFCQNAAELGVSCIGIRGF